jgi:predicted lipoprotein with Yx(FWY)xxD motif
MRTIRRALIALLPLSVLSVAACGTTAPVAGAAYGASASMSASPSSSATAATTGGAPMIPAKTELLVEKTSAGYVLATATGRTVYWYAKDVKGSGKSSCAAACLQAWPAVKGTPSAAPGVKLAGTFGTIKGTGGVTQATYDGYPLYTYAGDTAAAQVTGNDSGGVWHVFSGAKVSADAAAAYATSSKLLSGKSAMSGASPSATPSSSGMGY